MNFTKYIIEIATSDFPTTASAVKGGADRIELCANLAEGGTTASYAMIKKCRDAFPVALYPIIRPRGGDFLYSDEEFEIMLDDIKLCKQLGCDGIVVGLLDTNGEIDYARTATIAELGYPMGITFHRAFDRCKDPFTAMERLIETGVERLLTSGQQPSVVDGVDLVTELNKIAAGRIIIMPGSGVRADNIRMLADKTGCIEFHSSLRGKVRSSMEFVHEAFKDSSESYTNNAIAVEDVQQLRQALIS